MRWAWVGAVVLGLAALLPGRAEATPFGALAQLLDAARDDLLTAETVARRRIGVPRIRTGSGSRSAMRVSRAPHYTRNYRAGYAPSSTRW